MLSEPHIPSRLLLMWDWSSTGLWDADRPEIGIDPAVLGLSQDTCIALREWVERGSRLADDRLYESVSGGPSRAERRHETDMYRLLRRIQSELSAGIRIGMRDGDKTLWADELSHAAEPND